MIKSDELATVSVL